MSVGSQIRIARKKLGFSQEKLADILGVDRYKIVNAERDRNKSAQELIVNELVKKYDFDKNFFDPDSDINKDVKDKLIEQMEIRLAEQAKIEELEKKVDWMRGAIEGLLEKLEKQE